MGRRARAVRLHGAEFGARSRRAGESARGDQRDGDGRRRAQHGRFGAVAHHALDPDHGRVQPASAARGVADQHQPASATSRRARSALAASSHGHQCAACAVLGGARGITRLARGGRPQSAHETAPHALTAAQFEQCLGPQSAPSPAPECFSRAQPEGEFGDYPRAGRAKFGAASQWRACARSATQSSRFATSSAAA